MTKQEREALLFKKFGVKAQVFLDLVAKAKVLRRKVIRNNYDWSSADRTVYGGHRAVINHTYAYMIRQERSENGTVRNRIYKEIVEDLFKTQDVIYAKDIVREFEIRKPLLYALMQSHTNRYASIEAAQFMWKNGYNRVNPIYDFSWEKPYNIRRLK